MVVWVCLRRGGLWGFGCRRFCLSGSAGGVEPAFVICDLFVEGLGGVELVGVEEEEGELHVGAGGGGGVVDAVGFGGGDGAGHGVGEGPEGGDLGGGVEVHDFEVLLDGFVGGVEAASCAVGVDGGAGGGGEALFAPPPRGVVLGSWEAVMSFWEKSRRAEDFFLARRSASAPKRVR